MSYLIIKVGVMTPHSTYKTIIFDLDGTLLDTWPSLLQAVRTVTPGVTSIEPAALRLALSQGIGAMFARATDQMELDADAAQATMRDMERAYFGHALSAAVPYPNTDHTLTQLQGAGFTLALCTNRDRASTLALLDQAGWRSLFSHIHCLDDGLPPKPDPAAILATLAHLQCPLRDALFVGDSWIDAHCAAQAGVDFAAHLGGYHTHPGELAPAVLSYRHTRELSQWLAERFALLPELNHD
ncbi:MAG: HAD family hydrolase [Advenella sp.]|nr:HAD family hydrolase [Advenella sp. FME57]